MDAPSPTVPPLAESEAASDSLIDNNLNADEILQPLDSEETEVTNSSNMKGGPIALEAERPVCLDDLLECQIKDSVMEIENLIEQEKGSVETSQTHKLLDNYTTIEEPEEIDVPSVVAEDIFQDKTAINCQDVAKSSGSDDKVRNGEFSTSTDVDITKNSEQLLTDTSITEPAESVNNEAMESIDSEPADTVDNEPTETIDTEIAETIDTEIAETIDNELAKTVDNEFTDTVNNDNELAKSVDKDAAKNFDLGPAESPDNEPAENVDESPKEASIVCRENFLNSPIDLDKEITFLDGPSKDADASSNKLEVTTIDTLSGDSKDSDDESKDLHESVDLGEDLIAYEISDTEPNEGDIFSKDVDSIIADEDGGSASRVESCTNTDAYIISLKNDEDVCMCMICKEIKSYKYYAARNETITYLCSDMCLNSLKESCPGEVNTNDLHTKTFLQKDKEEAAESTDFQRKCAECEKLIVETDDVLAWETMDFCKTACLGKYQKKIGSVCASCDKPVLSNLLGKYCVRFGCILRQFCSSGCLESYKKLLKVCSYCQEDMSSNKTDIVNKNVKGQQRDFCSTECCDKYSVLNERVPRKEGLCAVCHQMKKIEVEYEHDKMTNKFCSEPCFVAFKFVNNIATGLCNMCNKHFSKLVLKDFAMVYDGTLCYFCSKTCQNIYTIVHRSIIPCSWCKVKKYNFDMIQKKSSTGENLTLCSLNCLSLLDVSVSAVSSKDLARNVNTRAFSRVSCDHCRVNSKAIYHLTMSDASIRNFCSYNCVMLFQGQFSKAPIVLAEPLLISKEKKSMKTYGNKKRRVAPPETPNPMPIITSVMSLAPEEQQQREGFAAPASTVIHDPSVKKLLMLKRPVMPKQRNMATMTRTLTEEKATFKETEFVHKECQTDIPNDAPNLITIPVPIYVPSPILTFRAPFLVPKPFPLPFPVPTFIPITKNTSHNVLKELKKVQVKGPTDPFEAELLMMAELVADKKEEPPVENDEDLQADEPAEYSPEPMDTSTPSFGDDVLQMAFSMASGFEEPAVDLEGALTANTISAAEAAAAQRNEETVADAGPVAHIPERAPRGRRRGGRAAKTSTPGRRGRRSYNHVEVQEAPQNVAPPLPPEPVEKPDANMCLKYTFGVNAWKQWVTTKNTELEKCSRRPKLFKTEILQLTADELNYSLCLFVKEVRKPNGAEYAPDTIYYLCLGIQQYLYENGRIDNIFCDTYYEKFTDCLDEVCKKFSVLYNESHYIVTRVEEEHLWESKQLGAHSPHVLLSTLMFFNTKHFNLTTVDEHMQLSFSHIMKHWKRSGGGGGGGGGGGSASSGPSSGSKSTAGRNVLLRFYPPQNTTGNSRKRRVYEQQENEENPLRCPVKLYEFYLSKCPESVKTRSDVFYLLPERSCVPDSPVWYSTSALGRNALEKMLHRVKMVKEVNVAVLTA